MKYQEYPNYIENITNFHNCTQIICKLSIYFFFKIIFGHP